MKKILFWIGSQILRPIYSTLFNLIIFIPFYGLKFLLSKKARANYFIGKHAYDNINTYDKLLQYFSTTYKYKYDLFKGFLDHDNTYLEFFMSFGDCDDMANFAKRKLKQLGYHDVIRVNMLGKSMSSGHVDCYYKKDGRHHLFNYGKVITENSLDNCMKKLKWYNDKYNEGEKPYYFKIWY